MDESLAEESFDATRVARFLRGPGGALRVAVVNVVTGAELASFPIDRTREGMAAVMAAVVEVRERIAAAHAAVAPAAAPAGPSTADLIIAHSAEEGTTIRTRLPNDRRFNGAITGLGRGFKWSREGGHWYRLQSIGTAKPTLNLEMAAENLRAKGAAVYVEPVEEVSELEAARVKHDHLVDRSLRYHDRSAKHAAASKGLVDRSFQMSDRIPFGQPILLGHHSESADRNFRKRIETTMRKGLAEREEAERLRDLSDSREAEAARYTPEAIEAVKAHNEWVDSLLAILTKRLKADVGAARISTRRGAAKAQSADVTVTYPAESPPWHVVEIHKDGGVTVRSQMNMQGRVSVRRGWDDTPDEVYARVVEALPKASAASAELTAASDPDRFAHELAAYAMKRLKRSVGADRVDHGGINESSDMNARRVSMVTARWSSGQVSEWWGIYVIGTTLRVRYARSYSVTTVDKGVALEADVSNMTVPKAYELAVKAINDTRPTLPKVERPW